MTASAALLKPKIIHPSVTCENESITYIYEEDHDGGRTRLTLHRYSEARILSHFQRNIDQSLLYDGLVRFMRIYTQNRIIPTPHYIKRQPDVL